MVDRAEPVLSPEDYLAFQQLVPKLPDTFEEWKAEHNEELRAAYRAGKIVIKVVIYPDAFAEFLRQQGLAGT